MGLLTYLIITGLFGLFIGALGRLALPGPDPMSLWLTMLIGVVATWLSGLVVWFATGHSSGAGIPIAAAFATFIVYLIRRSRGGGLEDPGVPPSRRRRS